MDNIQNELHRRADVKSGVALLIGHASTNGPVADNAALWPNIECLRLAPDLQAARLQGIGGSDANTILSGDSDRIRQLWHEKRGEAEQEDLTGRLPVMLGCWTEAFNRQWFERDTGFLVSAVGAVSVCPEHNWRRCTLDGYVAAKSAVFEAKHTSAFAKPEEILERYMPQLQHNLAVTGSDLAILSVIFGNHKWEVYEVAADWLYQEELLIAEARFWDCVRTGEVPVAAPIPAPPKPVGVREVCFDGNNAWAAAAADWLENRDQAKRHGSAVTTLKGFVAGDVSRAFGHGLEIKRSKAGALSIRELAR